MGASRWKLDYRSRVDGYGAANLDLPFQVLARLVTPFGVCHRSYMLNLICQVSAAARTSFVVCTVSHPADGLFLIGSLYRRATDNSATFSRRSTIRLYFSLDGYMNRSTRPFHSK